jgi:predicted RNA-binding protein with PIN domain
MTSEPGPAPSAGGASGDDAALRRPLPEAVRERVIEYGSDVLGGLRPADLPPVLRRVARFEPRRRARLAGPQIAAQLESDPGFRARVADRVGEVWPELAEGLRRGVVPPAADPVAVGAAAYLLRPEGWREVVEGVHGELERRAEVREVDAAADTIADLRRKIHGERQRAREAVERAEQAIAEAAGRSATTTTQVSAVEAENRRLRNRLAAAEAQVENARRAARTGRSVDDARLRVLLDVLLDASHGLRRELALPTSIAAPADLVADDHRTGARDVPGLGLPNDDPALVDRLLTLPRVHVLVDGYNVTKTGYGTLPLADQRTRLLASLEGLASRTKAEITCVFDGADVDTPVAAPATRRVRLLFSDPGETADALIVRLVRLEPRGRPLGVVTSDKEIVAAVRREGARTVPSALLLRRLEAPG